MRVKLNVFVSFSNSERLMIGIPNPRFDVREQEYLAGFLRFWFLAEGSLPKPTCVH
jgi:hypothetical protein